MFSDHPILELTPGAHSHPGTGRKERSQQEIGTKLDFFKAVIPWFLIGIGIKNPVISSLISPHHSLFINNKKSFTLIFIRL